MTISGDSEHRGVVASASHEARPFGIREWEVVKVRTDLGLRCLKCQRRVLLARGIFRGRVQEFVSRSV